MYHRAARVTIGTVSYIAQACLCVVTILSLLTVAIGPPILIYCLMPTLVQLVQAQQAAFLVDFGAFLAIVAGLGGISYVFTKGADGIVRGLKVIGSELLSAVRGPWQFGVPGLRLRIGSSSSGLLNATKASLGLVASLLLLSMAVSFGESVTEPAHQKNDGAQVVTVDPVEPWTLSEIVGENGSVTEATIMAGDGTPMAKVRLVQPQESALFVVRNEGRHAIIDLTTKVESLAAGLAELDSDVATGFAALSEQVDRGVAETDAHLDRHRDQIVGKLRVATSDDHSEH